ncbi:MAG TPA: hypothetical protein VL523_19600 [Terriglobia bacterium]|nr:hypothetical protein [Terriglobia bacterium]
MAMFNKKWCASQRISVLGRRAVRTVLGRCGLVLLLVPSGLLGAAAGNQLEKTIQCIPTPRISISNPPGGVVVVRGWDKSEVHAVCLPATPKVTIDCDQVPARGDAEKVRFTTQVLDTQAGSQEKTVNYEIDIPSGASLEIYNPSGSVTVERVSGDDGVESVSGSVSVRDGAGHTSVTSLSGAIELIRPTGRVEATSITGDLRFTASESANVHAQTTSGAIFFDGDFVPLGEYVLSSYGGNMDVACPTSDSVELRARTVRGKVNNELRLKHAQPRSPSAPGNGFGVQNQGDATVELKSYSGTIHVHSRP